MTMVFSTWQLLLAAWLIIASCDYSRELLVIPKGDEQEVDAFVHQHMEPRHAVAVVVAGKGTKRHDMLEGLAREDVLQHLLAFGIQFAKGPSSLTLHRYGTPDQTDTKIEYSGKWTRSALLAWLRTESYPLINRMNTQFAPAKYMGANPYGTVLVVKPEGSELIRALTPHATELRERIKFTFFAKTPGTQSLCDVYGIWSNDELVLLEEPWRTRNAGTHSSVPPAPKYRLEHLTTERINNFFAQYLAKTWPAYYKPAGPRAVPFVAPGGIRELTGWDFVAVTRDPAVAVLVLFVSQNCDNCDDFVGTYTELAAKVQTAQRQTAKGSTLNPLAGLIVARIDQSTNEHPEVVKGTPWLRYWPRGLGARKANGIDVETRSVEGIWDFLENQAAEESDDVVDSSALPRKNAKSGPGRPDNCAADDTSARCVEREIAAIEGSEERKIDLGKPGASEDRRYLSTEQDL